MVLLGHESPTCTARHNSYPSAAWLHRYVCLMRLGRGAIVACLKCRTVWYKKKFRMVNSSGKPVQNVGLLSFLTGGR